MHPIPVADQSASLARKTRVSHEVSAALGTNDETERKREPATGPALPELVAPAKKRRGTTPQAFEVATLPEALLKLQTASAIAGISIASIYRREAAGTFPPLIRLGSRCSRVRAGSLMAWLAAQK
jgi:prophage regulatory protein